MEKKDKTRHDAAEQRADWAEQGAKELKVIQKKDLWRFRGGIAGSGELPP